MFKKVAPLFPELKTIMETESEAQETPNPVPAETSIKVGSIKPTLQHRGMGISGQKKPGETAWQKAPIKLSKNTIGGKKDDKRSNTPKEA